MRINPINRQNNNTKFRAVIKPSESLKEGFDMMERLTTSGLMKNMNFTKEFLDSLARIRESKKIPEYKIEIDKSQLNHAHTKINGIIKEDLNEVCPNVQDSYLVVESTKKYASELEEIEPSILDTLKTQIEEAELALDELKERYRKKIAAELEQAKKMIFKSVE